MNQFQSITPFKDFESLHIDAVPKDELQFLWVGLNVQMNNCLEDHRPFRTPQIDIIYSCDACNSDVIKKALEMVKETRRSHVEQTYPEANAWCLQRKDAKEQVL